MANQTALPAIPSDIAFITGPTMLGICLNWGFMGILLVQTYFYHLTFKDTDQRAIRFLDRAGYRRRVPLVRLRIWELATLDDTFINSWDVPFLDAVIATVVQTFYCWRIWILSKSLIFPVFIFLVSLTQCGAGIATAVKAFKGHKLSLIGIEEVAEQTTWLVASVVADILITAVMSFTLIRSRSRTISAKSTIDRIVRITVETNMLTAGVAIIALGLYLGFPNHSTFVVPPTAIFGKLYSNCLVAVLNNRRLPSGGKTSSSAHVTSGSSNAHSFRLPATSQTDTIRVEVLRQTDKDTDLELDDLPRPSDSKQKQFDNSMRV
ncbi:uncharacterized protein BXZ73DRAFT_101567 [Epithele typhae]|uniref:uncharacterized protein n=1 Tax=Epithele typhae TaxID=378194 RepID=UPI00200790C7|nr:uncharacterized protein BXZ73DRAFT_101567 [Epithele typhae]KAH9931656.1 hypothetical protein BXZ73DRAFT_101567 [Epithele typhae]